MLYLNHSILVLDLYSLCDIYCSNHRKPLRGSVGLKGPSVRFQQRERERLLFN